MKVIKFFWRSNCPKCEIAKEMQQYFSVKGVPVESYNLDTPGGLAEGAFYSVLSVPTAIVVDKSDNLVAEWRGEVPEINEVEKHL